MRSTGDLVAYLLPRYGGGAVERFGVVLLDQKQRVIRSVILSTGTVEASISHPRDVFRAAVLASASSVVVFHNHPSGDPLPSAMTALSRGMRWRGELMSVDVIDHIILGGTTLFQLQGRVQAVKILLRLFRRRGRGHDSRRPARRRPAVRRAETGVGKSSRRGAGTSPSIESSRPA